MHTVQLSDSLFTELWRIAVPFEETKPEDVIARLVRDYSAQNGGSRGASPQISTNGLMASGVLIPNGLQLRGAYRGRQVEAAVRDGRIWVGDKDYSAPSAAAVGAAMELGAKGGALNGWYWWEFETPAGSGKWKLLDTLRSAANRRKNSA